MNRRLARSVMLLFSLTIGMGAFAPVLAAMDAEAALVEKAERFVDQLSRGRFEEAAAPFDRAMRGAAPPDKLKEIWSELIEVIYGISVFVDLVYSAPLKESHCIGNSPKCYISSYWNVSVSALSVPGDALSVTVICRST